MLSARRARLDARNVGKCDNEGRCVSLLRTGSDDYPPRYTEPIIKEMSTRTFVEGTEVPPTSRLHLCACNMRAVSLRCRGCVISVADYNERRYGSHGNRVILSALQISLRQTFATVRVYVY